MPASSSLLYHYTSSDSLLGILESGCLWATDIRFLNDTAEFAFARDLLFHQLSLRAIRLRNGTVRELIEEALNRVQRRKTVPAYVISLSEHGNALSQWRAYARRDGVAIGFHIGALRAIEKFNLLKCHYAGGTAGEGQQKQLQRIIDSVYNDIGWVARLIQQEARRKTHSRQALREAQKERTIIVDASFVWACLQIKHGGFAEEREWRLIDNDADINKLHASMKDPDDKLQFRRGTFGVTPYVRAILPKKWRGMPLGIAKVVVGPSVSSEATVASIQELLRIKFGSAAPVESCNIPYRG